MSEPLLGLLAEFGSEGALVDAVKRTRKAGFRCIDTFTPYPVDGMAELIGFHDHRIGWLSVTGGLVGFFGMLSLQLFVNFDYPVEVGGRPIFAYPAFFVVDFEIMILCAVLFPVIGMLVLNGLPKLHHPLFGTARFGLASNDRFFLYIDGDDARFDPEATWTFLGSLGAWTVEPVRP
jgi:hypothetical protein